MLHGLRRLTAISSLALLALALASPLAAETITVPAGTPIDAELDVPVTTHKHRITTGDIVYARVIEDVVVEQEVVIAAGTEVRFRVVDAKKARFLGRKGRLTLEALSVRAVDGSALRLTGGYQRLGKGRKTVTAALSVAVAWPFLFLRGKNATVPAGTVIATELAADTEVSTLASGPAW